MIVQTAAPGSDRHFVILQTDHALASAQLAAAFGTAQFAGLQPAEQMLNLIAHHDEGWAQVDANAELEPESRLPHHLVRTPTRLLLKTGPGAPDFNEKKHVFCGLITSMHTYGLYHGRYGLSDMVFINHIAPELLPDVQRMLQHELDRQARLKPQLPEARADEAFVFNAYKLLQFFDTLALYVQTNHASGFKEAAFKNVPRAIGDDVSIMARPLGDDRIALAPYPFGRDGVEITTRGRYLMPVAAGQSLATAMAAAPFETQTFRMVA